MRTDTLIYLNSYFYDPKILSFENCFIPPKDSVGLSDICVYSTLFPLTVLKNSGEFHINESNN